MKPMLKKTIKLLISTRPQNQIFGDENFKNNIQNLFQKILEHNISSRKESISSPILYYFKNSEKKDIYIDIPYIYKLLNIMSKRDQFELIKEDEKGRSIFLYLLKYNNKQLNSIIKKSSLIIKTLCFIKKNEKKYTYNISILPYDIRKYLI